MKEKPSLIFPKNYFNRWRDFSRNHTGPEAWEEVERELYRETGTRRYASYESFLHGKSREKMICKSRLIRLFIPETPNL